MKNKRLLFSAVVAGLALNAQAKMINDYEAAGADPCGSGWDAESAIVDNPFKTGNTSDKCTKVTPKLAWGVAGEWMEESTAKYKVVADFFVANDVTITCHHTKLEADRTASLKGGRWNRVSFDFSSAGEAEQSMVYFGWTADVWYVDNVQVVGIDEEVKDYDAGAAYVPSADLDYTFGQVKMGGGGFVSGLVTGGKTMLARTDVGGAYLREGKKWKPITNFITGPDQGLYSIESAAIDPSNPKNIYLLGGCQYFSNQKTAILRSEDGGESFEIVDLQGKIYAHGNGNGRNCGERLAVDPNNGNILFCGGRCGAPLLKSTDKGKTWSVVATFPDVYGTKVNWPAWENNSQATTKDENGTTAVLIDRNDSKRIYVGISQTGGKNLYVSEDGGTSWKEMELPDAGVMPTKLKQDADGNILVVCSSACVSGERGAVYRIEEGKFVDISPKLNGSTPGMGDVASAPSDAKKMVAVTNNTWMPQTWENGTSANGDVIWTSTDGGANWKCHYGEITLHPNGVTWISSEKGSYALHWCGAIAIDPNDENRASFCSGNGIFTCDDIWGSKLDIYFDVDGLEETVPLDMVSVPGGKNYSVIGDYSGFIHTDVDKFPPIHDPAPGTTGGINYYRKDSKVMMRVANTGFYITTSGETGWKEVGKTDYEYRNPYCPGCDPLVSNEGKCCITKENGTLKFLLVPGPGESGIYSSTDEGKSWTKIAGAGYAKHIVTDAVNDAYIYVGGGYLKDGWQKISAFYRSEDYGKTFEEVVLPEVCNSRVCVVTGKEGLVYLPGDANGLLVSTDYGKTFAKVSGVTACEAVGSGKGKADGEYALYIYGAVDGVNGIYRSTDEGATWQILNDRAHQYGTTGNGQFIVGDENVFGRFYMSTVGMGIVYGADNSTSDPAAELEMVINSMERAVVYPNPTENEWTIGEEGEYEVVSSVGRVIERGVSDGTRRVGAGYPAGVYFLRMEGRTAKMVKK